MRLGTVVRLLAVAAALAAGTLCTNETNPYAGTALTDAAFTDLQHHDGDTVNIFTSFTVTVGLSLQGHIERFRLRTEHNRLESPYGFVVMKEDFGTRYLFPFRVSFYDTGFQRLSITAWLDNGDSIVRSMSLYARSPLNQPNLVALKGEKIGLSTQPVGDNDVYYVWEFSRGQVIYNAPTCSTVLNEDAEVTTANLFVTAGGSYRSPAQHFTVSLKDIMPPSVAIRNDSVSGRNHVYTGNVPFYLRLQVRDNSPGIGAATINGATFDRVEKVDDRTYNLTKQITTLSRTGEPLQLLVRVSDAAGNVRSDTVWAHYDPKLVVDAPVIRFVVPPSDNFAVKVPTLTMRGYMENIDAYGDSLRIFISVNGSRIGDGQPLPLASPKWYRVLALPRDTNVIVVTAVNRPGVLNQTVATAELVVRVDRALEDKTKPVLADILTAGVSIKSDYYTTASDIPLTIVAYDAESGIQSVTVNGEAANMNQHGDYTLRIPLRHVAEGNNVAIKVKDSSANVEERTIRVFRNNPPRISRMPHISFATAGAEYVDTIAVSDPDNDNLETRITVDAATHDTELVVGSSGAFRWTFSEGDTVSAAKLSIRVSDGYQSIDTSYQVTVQPPAAPIIRPRFTTTADSFPDTLKAEVDTLRRTLRVEPAAQPGTYLFSGIVDSSGLSLLSDQYDTTVYWVAQAGDVGVRQLVFSVTSGPGLADSLKPRIVVIPAPKPLTVSFQATTGSAGEAAGTLDIGVILSRLPDSAVTVEYQINNALTTAHAWDYSLPADRTVRFARGVRLQHARLTIVDDNTPESEEVVSLALVNPSPGLATAAPSSYSVRILDNDTAVDTAVASFVTVGSTVQERWLSIPVVVALAKPVSRAVQFALGVSGNAAQGKDYTLRQTTVSFGAGEVRDTVIIDVADNYVCELANETAVLKLRSSDASQKPGTDSVYTLVIVPSHPELCNKKVIMLSNQSSPLWPTDVAIADTLRAMGFDVTVASPQYVTPWLFNNAGGVFLSQSVRSTASLGPMLRTLVAPVFCASLEFQAPMGMSAAYDTGHTLGSDLRLLDPSAVRSDSIVRIAESFTLIPWSRPAGSGGIMARIPAKSLGGWVDTLRGVIASYPKGASMASGLVAPAKRCSFPMCQTAEGRPPVYRADWWVLLKAYFQWLMSAN